MLQWIVTIIKREYNCYISCVTFNGPTEGKMKRKSYNVEMEMDAYEHIYHAKCAECGEDFQSSRTDAAFCSSKCRTRNHRAAANHSKRIQNAVNEMKWLLSICGNNPDSEAVKAVMTLDKLIRRKVDNMEAPVFKCIYCGQTTFDKPGEHEPCAYCKRPGGYVYYRELQ